MRLLIPAACRANPSAWLLPIVLVAGLLASATPARSQGFFQQLFGFDSPRRPAATTMPQSTRPRMAFAPGPIFQMRDRPHDEVSVPKSESGPTYRTVCVRACDGFYIPMSFATRAEGFYQDQAKCRATCGGEARLFYYRNPGSEMTEAVDLSGRAYSRLPNAFRFRKTLVEGCSCRPPPWSDAELARHRNYASTEAPAMAARAPVTRAGNDAESLPVVAAMETIETKSQHMTLAAAASAAGDGAGPAPQTRERPKHAGKHQRQVAAGPSSHANARRPTRVAAYGGWFGVSGLGMGDSRPSRH